ncbi:molybdopterin-dependent oxidoreductase [Luteimonas sp. SJ-92]|uniref:Molybdopterin-dependent oxidoreductase n=1 Tax=Luteimonas salinisoli TaxID=2752307 RepID=A0A853JCF4_9GAMM|nr:nitrate reductase [Luteimonas salinisoli]NZA26270.1 molybdopterin-dependent oxidoreductase [Luteimonas salinisoli]
MLPEAVPAPRTQRRETRSTCCYCGIGCGVVIESGPGTDGRDAILGVRGDETHPANFGRLCSKGATLHLSAAPEVYAQARAATPEVRTARDRPRQPCGWDAALDLVAGRLEGIVRAHGPDALGIYVSGQLLTEDYYVFNKLAKGLVGTNNIDTNSRLCMSSAVAGYKRTLGADAPPCCYDDLDHAGTVFVAGANPAFAHPVLYRRLEEARRRNPRMRLVVADPRRTDTAEGADLHLPLAPGSDVALFLGMLAVMLAEDLVARDYVAAHTSGFAELEALATQWPVDRAAAECGLPGDDIAAAARWFAQGPTLSLYCQGLNQSSSGTDKNAALIHLHLATAQIGRPGAGPFSLTGQPNAMGGREVGGMANLLSAHRDLASERDRAEVAALWGLPSVPARPGRTAVEMFEAAAAGEIRALWIACTNPAQSLPDQRMVRRALERAEFVVVQDAYIGTATAPYADVLLPASGWGEKDGTVTNSERRISRVRAAVPGYADSREDWRIARDVAVRLEARLRPGRPSLFPYASAEQVWNEHRESTRGRDLDITGLSYAMLEAEGPQQWPLPQGAREGLARLYADGRFATADGRARFVASAPRAPAEPVDRHYPFALTGGRLRDQWHGMSRTGTVPQLFGHAPEPTLDLHPADAARIGVGDGDFVYATSRRASQVMRVRRDPGLRPGSVFAAMHWGEEWVGGRGSHAAALGINALTSPALDPASRQPELKHTAVKLLRAELPWQWVVAGYPRDPDWLALQRRLSATFADYAYASCVPFGRERSGLAWRVAAHAPVDGTRVREIEALFGIDRGALSYNDPRRASTRRLRIEDGRLAALSLAGDVSAYGWLLEYLEGGVPVGALGRLLLLPSRSPPKAHRPRGRTVCTCIGVGEQAIGDWLQAHPLAADEALAGLQAELRCGTACGSCVPELRRLVRERECAA